MFQNGMNEAAQLRYKSKIISENAYFFFPYTLERAYLVFQFERHNMPLNYCYLLYEYTLLDRVFIVKNDIT